MILWVIFSNTSNALAVPWMIGSMVLFAVNWQRIINADSNLAMLRFNLELLQIPGVILALILLVIPIAAVNTVAVNYSNLVTALIAILVEIYFIVIGLKVWKYLKNHAFVTANEATNRIFLIVVWIATVAGMLIIMGLVMVFGPNGMPTADSYSIEMLWLFNSVSILFTFILVYFLEAPKQRKNYDQDPTEIKMQKQSSDSKEKVTDS